MKCTAIIIAEELFYKVSRHIIGSDSFPEYIISKHEGDCVDLDCYGTHYHVITWTNNCVSDTALGRYLRKHGHKYIYVYYNAPDPDPHRVWQVKGMTELEIELLLL